MAFQTSSIASWASKKRPALKDAMPFCKSLSKPLNYIQPLFCLDIKYGIPYLFGTELFKKLYFECYVIVNCTKLSI